MAGRSRTITDPSPPQIPGQRMPAPSELTDPQRAQWEAVVARLPTGWITNENAPLLKELCRHISFADELARDIELARASDKPADRKIVLRLMREHGYQTARVASLSTKLRLTHLSRFTRSAESAAIASRNSPSARPPWDDWGH
jgi:hypothetical protein